MRHMNQGATSTALVLTDEVRDTIEAGAPVVALESTIISHGLPSETSATTAREIEAAVRTTGAVPATVAVVDVQSWDESADLVTLGSVPVTIVCAGVKSILDVAATLERLETLSVPLVGYRTDRVPGFYVRDAGHPVPWRLDGPDEVAAVMRSRRALRLRQALVVAQPVGEADEMDRDLHERTLQDGLAEIGRRGVRGKDVTPFLLGWFHERTGGASLAANVSLVLANARLAGEVALAFAGDRAPDRERLTARGRS
jgi:pseudouridine-5'-phosphate glycosidase